MAVVEGLAVAAGNLPCSAVGNCTLWSAEIRQEKRQGERTTDEPVSVLVIIAPAALVVITVRHGTVVVLFPDIRTSPVMVKTFPAKSVVVTSVVGMAAGVPVVDCWGIAWSAELVLVLVLEVWTGKATVGRVMVTPADAQNCRANDTVTTEIAV